ncbi:MAG TPA: CsiV family protein [Nevskiaceae bacterium]|nr:CsiV family protein [Nevskiaceae bacterium]
MTRAALLLLLLAVVAPVRAETYRVDLIVFRNLWGTESGERAPAARAVDLRGAIEPTDVAALARAGIQLVPDGDFALGPEWASLKSSKQFRPLIRLAWTQTDPPQDRGPSILIRGGTKMTLTDPSGFGAREGMEIEGKVSLLLTRFLHLDADLRYMEAGTEPLAIWPLTERRRMRRDELHHLDSPRLGIVAKVTKPPAPGMVVPPTE